MEMIQIHFKHKVGKYGPCIKFAYDFCAGIGPLQLGVVLVHYLLNDPCIKYLWITTSDNLILVQSMTQLLNISITKVSDHVT